MQFEPRTYGTARPARRPAIGHNAILALALFFCFVAAIVWPTNGVAGGYILGGAILAGGLALLTHPWIWGK
jgi:hypothetical protein